MNTWRRPFNTEASTGKDGRANKITMIYINQQLLVPPVLRWVIIFILGAMVVKIVPFAANFRLTPGVWERMRVDAIVIVFGFAAVVLFFLFTVRRGLEINVRKKSWRKVIAIPGFRLGFSRPFGGIEKIFVNKLRMTQNPLPVIPGIPALFPAYSEYVYKAFLKFDDGEKIELLVNSDKDNLMRMLNRYNDTLQTAIWDNTGE